MEKATLHRMLFLDHENGILTDNLLELFRPLLRDAVSTEIWKIGIGELSPHLTPLFESLAELHEAQLLVEEKRQNAYQIFLNLMRQRSADSPLLSLSLGDNTPRQDTP